MGGSAFVTPSRDGSPGLNVPRMTPDLYDHFKAVYGVKLSSFFEFVKVPREAPGKEDHGDIDFLVEGTLGEFTIADVGEALGSIRYLCNGNTHSFAVENSFTKDTYIQIDVEVCHFHGEGDAKARKMHIEWTQFMKSDGDLLQILGAAHRPLGITFNDKGLHVRIEQIEGQDRKKSMVFLTNNPDAALGFLGYDVLAYQSGFDTLGDLYEWASAGRYFDLTRLQEKQGEKHNDRQRLKKRVMYRDFIERYVPQALKESGVYPTQPRYTREEVLKNALAWFNKEDEYKTKVRKWEAAELESKFWERVKSEISDHEMGGKRLAIIMRGFKRWTDFDEDGTPFIRAEPFAGAGEGQSERPLWVVAMCSQKPPSSKDTLQLTKAPDDERRILNWMHKNWDVMQALEKSRVMLNDQT